MDIDLRDMRWALIASQYTSLRKAAESLNIRQSTLSRHIRDLEYHLDVLLFDRTNGGTRPTAAGLEFLSAVQHVLAEIDAAFVNLKARNRGENGLLTLGVCAALSAGNLRATLSDFLQRFPGVEVRTANRPRSHLLLDVASNKIDVAIIVGKCSEWTGKTLRLWSERVVVALPQDHLLRAHQRVHWDDLKGERFLIGQGDPGPEFHRLLLTKIGCFDPGKLKEHDIGIDRLLSLVGLGLGATLILEGATGASYPGVIYREVRDESGPTFLTFNGYWRQENGNPALQPFLTMLRDRYPDLTAPSASTDT